MAAAFEEEAKKRIKGVLENMEPLPERISKLLQQHGNRRVTAAGDRVLRSWEFIEFELRGLVASLKELLSSELGPDYVDEYLRIWLNMSSERASDIGTQLDGSEQATLRGCHAQLGRAAAHCISRDAGLQLPHPDNHTLQMLSLVAESHCRYKHLLQDDDGDRTSKTSSSAQPHPHADAGGIPLVGIEGALRNKKLTWFMADREDNKTLKVISMVGPAGVGKTALATEVYRQLQQIGGHYFQCCATAKVSQRPDMKELLKHILSQINKTAALALESSIQRSQQETEEEALVRNINEYLQDKRYLIVIDDIWKESDWDIIKDAFPQNRQGSRIMITTQLRSVAHSCCSHFADGFVHEGKPLSEVDSERLRSVAHSCCSHFADGFVHEVKPLSEVDSERLLFRKAFGSEDGCPPENLKQACDEILRRCEGIPLFIIGMADWLKEQREVQHISTNYSMDSIFPKLPKQFERALATIYDDLPYRLKALLLYMSMFPEGHIFDKDSLIRKWSHQLMIYYPERDYFDLIVRMYFSELINRSVITRVAANRGHNHRVEEDCHWHVNYFMLQFLASKSAGKGSFCTSGTLTSVVAAGGKRLRRLSLHQPDPELPTRLGNMDLSHTRLLLVSGEVSQIPLDKFTYLVVLDLTGWQCFKNEDMLLICKMFLLRYLSLSNTKVSELPPEIKELQQLVMLDISHTRICELPSRVCELPWLETLDLRSTQVRKLPEQIWKLQSLRHLLVGGDGVNHDETATEIPEGIGHLKFLRTLATIHLSQCSSSLVEALGGIEKLVVLAITWSFTDEKFQEALRSSIKKWRELWSLTIHCRLGCCMDFLDSLPDLSGSLEKFEITGGRFARLPQWFRVFNRLAFIEITVCTLLPGDLGTLAKLPWLECLVLGLHFIPEAAIVIDGAGFRRLQRLSLSCRVPWLTFTQGAMPELTYLQLKIAGSPASQESIPTGISNLRHLSEVALRYHANYTHSPSVKMTVEAVRKEAAKHFNPINLVINGILEEYVEAVEEDPARATESQSEIEIEG